MKNPSYMSKDYSSICAGSANNQCHNNTVIHTVFKELAYNKYENKRYNNLTQDEKIRIYNIEHAHKWICFLNATHPQAYAAKN